MRLREKFSRFSSSSSLFTFFFPHALKHEKITFCAFCMKLESPIDIKSGIIHWIFNYKSLNFLNISSLTNFGSNLLNKNKTAEWTNYGQLHLFPEHENMMRIKRKINLLEALYQKSQKTFSVCFCSYNNSESLINCLM